MSGLSIALPAAGFCGVVPYSLLVIIEIGRDFGIPQLVASCIAPAGRCMKPHLTLFSRI